MNFYMMIGLPCSGKDHFLKNMIRDSVCVHSSDDIRKELTGNINSQKLNTKVFDILHKRVIHDLQNGKDTVYNATNISMKRRIEFLCRLKKEVPGVKCTAIFMATEYHTCLSRLEHRNKYSEQVVTVEVLNKMYYNFDTPYYNEGWDDICVIILEENKYNIENMLYGPSGMCYIQQFNPHHTLTLGEHLERTYDNIIQQSDANIELICAALLHDIGKVKTMTYDEEKHICHYYNHENVGAYDSMFVEVPDLFGKSHDKYMDSKLLTALYIRWHMLPFALKNAKESTKENYKRLLTKPVWNDIMKLHQADINAR